MTNRCGISDLMEAADSSPRGSGWARLLCQVLPEQAQGHGRWQAGWVSEHAGVLALVAMPLGGRAEHARRETEPRRVLPR